MDINNLENCFNKAIEGNSRYVGVLVSIKDNKTPELIVNSKESLKDKLEYYKNTYDENLKHKHTPGIFIVGFTQGDSLVEIEDALLGTEWMTKEVVATIPTSRLVSQLIQREGVRVFRTGMEDKYEIKTEVINGSEEDKITTIRDNTGCCIILEVLD